MATRSDLKKWLIEALEAQGGQARIIDVCKYVWDKHEIDLRRSGDLFYSWQYDIRWAATQLRKEKIMLAENMLPKGLWKLA